MSFLSCYRELRSLLRLYVRRIDKPGEDVDEGDEFTVRFTVVNAAPNRSRPELPAIHFRSPRVIVEETPAGRPALGRALWLDFPQSYLQPGESSSLEVEIVARRPLSGLVDFVGGLDEVVRAWVTADVDPEVLLKLWVPSRADHEPTSSR